METFWWYHLSSLWYITSILVKQKHSSLEFFVGSFVCGIKLFNPPGKHPDLDGRPIHLQPTGNHSPGQISSRPHTGPSPQKVA